MIREEGGCVWGRNRGREAEPPKHIEVVLEPVSAVRMGRGSIYRPFLKLGFVEPVLLNQRRDPLRRACKPSLNTRN
jgi:hypothetical protein